MVSVLHFHIDMFSSIQIISYIISSSLLLLLVWICKLYGSDLFTFSCPPTSQTRKVSPLLFPRNGLGQRSRTTLAKWGSLIWFFVLTNWVLMVKEEPSDDDKLYWWWQWRCWCRDANGNLNSTDADLVSKN